MTRKCFYICLWITHLLLLCNRIIAIPTEQEQAILNSLSLDEKIGQLLMVGATVTPDTNSQSSQYQETDIKKFIQTYHIGGIIYLNRSTPEEQLAMTVRLQEFNASQNKLTLWFGLDAEWGPAMRLDNCIKFPFNIALGAVTDEKLIEKLGYVIGKQIQELGVSINFAPVADTNTNSENPVINRRSFGQYPELVASHADAYARGLEQAGIMACAKHFPGHGDTSVDSHMGIASINHDMERMKNIELAPFKYLIDRKIPSIMVGHLLLPLYDKDLPATISRAITTTLLKEECAFTGLVITDGLDMHGVTDILESGAIEVKALQAGADLLLIPADVEKAFISIKNAVLSGQIPQEELDEHVLHILHAKNIYTQPCHPETSTITHIINNQEAQELCRLLYQKAITLVRNDGNIPLTTNSITTVITIGLTSESTFVETLQKTQPIELSILSKNPSEQEIDCAWSMAEKSNRVVIGLAGLHYTPNTNYGIDTQVEELIKKIHSSGKLCTLVILGNPYSLKLFKEIPTVIEAYEEHPYAQQAAAEVLLGIIQAEGQLPITI